MHLVDHGRAYIEQHHRRPWPERMTRRLLASTIPYPAVFRLALLGSAFARPFAGLLPGQLRTMLSLAPAHLPPPSPVDRPQTFPADGSRRARVAMLTGCAQQVLAPQINEATARLLSRLGAEVVVPKGMGCCGALTHHMGKEESALAFARANIDAWTREIDRGGLDAVVINASGCGTTIKDYGFMFREDAAYAAKAARIAELAKDVTEVIGELGLPPASRDANLVVAYHSACSMQHGQKITTLPKMLLAQLGFTVRDVPEGHLCCGSAGTYNLLQPEIAGRLRDRKVANIESVRPDVIATGNIGCITQIGSGTKLPVVHTVELLDWATGGAWPEALREIAIPGL
ncbi:MAG: heterodisulfide reductase-related iron-sulfur binding cluster, partial [Geminicoccaceae bacterium]